MRDRAVAVRADGIGRVIDTCAPVAITRGRQCVDRGRHSGCRGSYAVESTGIAAPAALRQRDVPGGAGRKHLVDLPSR